MACALVELEFMDMAPHRQSGFSLMEVMIALTVLVVAVLATFSGIAKAHWAAERANASSLALDAIQAQMESYQTLPFATVDDLPLAATSPANFATPANAVGYAIPGLQPYSGTMAGAVWREPDSTTSLLHLVFQASWRDVEGPNCMRIHYYHVNRGQ